MNNMVTMYEWVLIGFSTLQEFNAFIQNNPGCVYKDMYELPDYVCAYFARCSSEYWNDGKMQVQTSMCMNVAPELLIS